MKYKSLFALLLCGMMGSFSLAQNEDDPLAGIKCIVNGDRAAQADIYADHLEGKVYFCCNACATKFKEDNQEYLTKANHQLALTGQYEQVACPISGNKALNDETIVKVGGAAVQFCCMNCANKVEQADNLAEQAEFVFSEDAFAKGYAKVADLSEVSCPISGGPVSQDHYAEFMDGKVYFCCGGCAKSFAKDSSQHANAARHQLVATGQYVQKGCPFSGNAVIDEAVAQVGNVAVGFCCTGCSGKVAQTSEIKDQLEMVFSEDAFGKGYELKK